MTDAGAQDLWTHVEGTAPLGKQTLRIPASGGPRVRQERQAKLTIRAVDMELIPPKSCPGQPSRMLAVSAKEMSPPKTKTALNWMLLCTEGTADLEPAKMILNRYRLRWQIERFLYALKQGTRIQDRQLNQADDLLKCVTFDAITAFRVWDLTWLGRIAPMSWPFGTWKEKTSRFFCGLRSPTGCTCHMVHRRWPPLWC